MSSFIEPSVHFMRYKQYANDNFKEFTSFEKYRPNTHHISFADFIQYYLEVSYPKLLPAVDNFIAHKTNKIDYPESIYSRIERKNNAHWLSFMYSCLPTNFNSKIDYIIRTETASQDSFHIFKGCFRNWRINLALKIIPCSLPSY